MDKQYYVDDFSKDKWDDLEEVLGSHKGIIVKVKHFVQALANLSKRAKSEGPFQEEDVLKETEDVVICEMIWQEVMLNHVALTVDSSGGFRFPITKSGIEYLNTLGDNISTPVGKFLLGTSKVTHKVYE